MFPKDLAYITPDKKLLPRFLRSWDFAHRFFDIEGVHLKKDPPDWGIPLRVVINLNPRSRKHRRIEALFYLSPAWPDVVVRKPEMSIGEFWASWWSDWQKLKFLSPEVKDFTRKEAAKLKRWVI